MTKKKIAESVEVRISLENYEHIIFTKYAEKEIEYDSPQDMELKEAELNAELVNSLIRDMRLLPDRLGKKTEAVQRVEESIASKLPDWLKSENVPNLANANKAKQTHERGVDAQQANKAKQEEKIEEVTEVLAEEPKSDIANDDELFEKFEQETVSELVMEENPVAPEAEAKEPVTQSEASKDNDFGDAEDWEKDFFKDV